MGSFGGPDMPHIRALRQYRKLAWKRGGGSREKGRREKKACKISEKLRFRKRKIYERINKL